MNRLVKAELLKLRTTRLVYVFLAVTATLTALGVIGTIASAGRVDGTFSLETREGIRNVFSAGGSGPTLMLVLGILGLTNEVRHGTITGTFLVTPHRRRVVMAKLATYGLVGLAFAAVSTVVTLAIGLPWLSAKGVDVSLLDADVIGPVLGLAAGAALNGVLGAGVGALIRNQVAAVTVALVWTILVEGLIIALVPEFARWSPGGAGSALAGRSIPDGQLLAPWVGGLVLAAYGFVLAAIGTRFVVQRDIT